MDGWDGLALLALVMLCVILAVLVMQYLQLGKVSRVVERWNAATQERCRRVGEHRELQSALRAERAHVQQLIRKVEILQAMLPAA